MNSFLTNSDNDESLALDTQDAAQSRYRPSIDTPKRSDKEAPARLNGKAAPKGWSGRELEKTIVDTVVPSLRGAMHSPNGKEAVLQSKSAHQGLVGSAEQIDAPPSEASQAGHSSARREGEADAVAALIAALVADDLVTAGGVCDPWFEADGFEQTCRLLLTPAAEELGRRWEDDTLDFARVTIAMTRLQHVLNDLSMREGGHSIAQGPSPSKGAILVTTPLGEQHVFGANMVAEFFRRAGWEVVRIEPNLALDIVSNQHFDIIGLSGSTEDRARAVGGFVRALRNQSRNRNVQVLFGGAALDPSVSSLADLADGYAADGASALKTAQKLLA
ncbi:MAG: cobalamin B12-binding domain-containing protein [Alphaproteobacteria bacterium]|nr:cobalamin B12-binding domain-containing protein [Alphaproteobacteria bacterium]